MTTPRIESSKPWHAGIDGARARQSKGDEAEEEFRRTFLCSCGGEFVYLHTYEIDLKCDNCGLLVNVKTSPATELYGNITISQRPFDAYPPDLVIAARRENHSDEAGRWVVCVRKDAEFKGPFAPTHRFRPTKFYKVSLSRFVPPEALGFIRKN